MGYRSDVKYVFVFPTLSQRTAFLAEVALDSADHDDPRVRELQKDFVVEKPTGPRDYPYVTRIHYEDVKWYPEYPSVRYMNKVKEMVERHDGQWAFVRVGEDVTDVEVESSPDIYAGDYLEVSVRSDFI